MLLLSSVRFYAIDAIMFVLLEIHPIYPDVVLAPGILINVEIHVEDVVTWKNKKNIFLSFLSVKTIYCDIARKKIILQNRPADLYNGNNFIRK